MANSEYNLTVVDGTDLTISLSGPAGPTGPAGGATPAGSTGSVQINNSGALAADSGLVYTGTGNTGVLKIGGGSVIMSDPTMSQNVAIGGGSPTLPFANRTTGNYNTSVGTGNLPLLTSGNSNVAIGTSTLANVTTGSNNFGFGIYALFALTSGANNIAIGTGVAGNITIGADNICIGGSPLAATDVSSISIGSTGDGSSKTVIGKSSTTQTRLVGNTLILGHASTLAQRTTITQTSSSTPKTITLPNDTGTVALTNPSTGTQTFTGTQIFSSTTRPISSGSGMPEPTSLIMRADAVDEIIFNMARIRRSDHAPTYTLNGGSSCLLEDGDSLITGTTANSRPVCVRYRQINRYNSGIPSSVCPIRIASFGVFGHPCAAGNGSRIRCGIGMPLGASIPAAESNALSGKGFGWEIYWDGSNMVFGLFAYNTSYLTTDGASGRSSPILTGLSASSTDAFLHVIIGLSSAGVVSAWTAFSNNPTTPMRPSGTPTLTLAGGPTSGFFATGGIQWGLMNHSTVAATTQTTAKILDRALIFD